MAAFLIVFPSVLIMLIYAIFHCLRLGYKESKASSIKLKCINLAMVSHLIMIASILSRGFSAIVHLLLFLPDSYHLSMFPGSDCTYYIVIIVELSIVTKFAIHLFVMLRSRIADIQTQNTSVWFKIVCGFL